MFPSMLAIIIGAIVVAFIVMGMYNSMVGKRQEVKEAWSAIDTELRRRFDLIPNLVETVKGYAGHEHDTLTDVIKARNATVTQGPLDAQVASQNALTSALSKLMVLSESYPQLKANENFMSLQNQLNETETRISQARRFYNAVVKEYNTMVQSFPAALIAGSFGFTQQSYYGIDDAAASEPVQVHFSKSGTEGGGSSALPLGQKDKL